MIQRTLPLIIITIGTLFVAVFISALPAVPARAERPMSITETSTAEPPTLTPTPTTTPTGSSSGSTPTPTTTPTGSSSGSTPTPTTTPTGSSSGSTPTPTATFTPIDSPALIPDLVLTKSVAPSVANVGDEVVYTLTLRNIGGAPATEVTIDDPLPAFLSLIGANASSGTVQLNGNQVLVTIPVVAPGEQVVVTIQARLLAEPLPPANQNVATARTSSVEITTDNNTSSATILPALPDLVLTKSVAPSVANVGDEVVYTLTLRNIGGAPATDVTIDDPLPAFLSLIGAAASSGTVQMNGNQVQVTIPVVAPGEQVVVTIQARLLAEPLPPENRNVATARTSSVEITTDNNTSSATILPALPDLALTKAVAPSMAQVGDEVVYTLTLRNMGSAPATDVTLLDNLPSFLSLSGVTTTAGNVQSVGNQVTVIVPVVNPGETVVVQITVLVLTPPTDPGNVNVASVRTSSSEITTDNNTSSAALIITTTPAILPQTGGHLSRSLLFLIGFALIVIGLGALVWRRSLD